MTIGKKGFQKGNKLWNNANSRNTQFKKGIKLRLGIKISDIQKIAHSKFMKEWYKNNESPKGMLGKKPWNKGKKCDYLIGNKHGLKKGQTNSGSFKEGENNPNWNGGISFKPYPPEFNKKLKNKIRNRDNNECILCRLEHEEKKKEFDINILGLRGTLLLTEFEAKMNKKLAIHHIDYNKNNNIKENLITLCNSHHTKTNHNREFWANFLNCLLIEKYNYKINRLILGH